MSRPQLNLIVLRVTDIEQSHAFFSTMDLEFNKHSHGSGPVHYTCENGSIVLELYPATEKFPLSRSTRLGFSVESIDRILHVLELEPAEILSPPANSPWGRRCVIEDPDGHRIELTESS